MNNLILATFTILMLHSCNSQPTGELPSENTEHKEGASEEIKAVTTSSITTTKGQEKLEEGKDFIEVFTTDRLLYILQHTDYEMFDEGGPDSTWKKAVHFRPDGWDTDFVYAQIDFIKGEVTKTAFVIFYPQVDGVLDNKGELSSEVFQIIQSEDHPCSICRIKSISNELYKDTDYSVLKGVFEDRLDNKKKIVKYMDYNFTEMLIYWNDSY